MSEKRNKTGGKSQKPLLEWIAAAIGLILTLFILGFIGWKAVKDQERLPPAISIALESITRTVSGAYLVEFTAHNLSPSTAANVEIEGRLMEGDREAASGKASLDYVPGNSERRGGLYFDRNPISYRLELSASGYSRP